MQTFDTHTLVTHISNTHNTTHNTQNTHARTQFKRKTRSPTGWLFHQKVAFPQIQWSNSPNLEGHWNQLAKSMHFRCRTCEQLGCLSLYPLSEVSSHHSLTAGSWRSQVISMEKMQTFYYQGLISDIPKFSHTHGSFCHHFALGSVSSKSCSLAPLSLHPVTKQESHTMKSKK